MTTLLRWSVASVVFAIACTSSGGAETLIGATCQSSDECDLNGICVLDGPQGMCAQPCQIPGGAGQCPLGSYCTFDEFSSDASDKAPMTLCLPACKAEQDCREGYACNDVSSGPGKVCTP